MACNASQLALRQQTHRGASCGEQEINWQISAVRAYMGHECHLDVILGVLLTLTGSRVTHLCLGKLGLKIPMASRKLYDRIRPDRNQTEDDLIFCSLSSSSVKAVRHVQGWFIKQRMDN